MVGFSFIFEVVIIITSILTNLVESLFLILKEIYARHPSQYLSASGLGVVGEEIKCVILSSFIKTPIVIMV